MCSTQLGQEYNARVARTPIEAELMMLKYRLVRSEAMRRDSSQQFAKESREAMAQMQVRRGERDLCDSEMGPCASGT